MVFKIVSVGSIPTFFVNCIIMSLLNYKNTFINFFENLFNLRVRKILDLKKIIIINGEIFIKHNNNYIKYGSKQKYICFLKKFNKMSYFNNNNISFKIEWILIYILKYIYQIQSKNFRFNYRLKQTDWGFYFNINNNKNLWVGLMFFWKIIKFWSISLIFLSVIFYFLMYIRLVPVNKILLGWLLVVMLVYWLLSGFVFFFKKYQYSKFTTVIQRFWKRTYILFWMIESCIFIIFFYLTLNSSSEPIYMYDQIRIYKTHLFSWRFFLIKLLPIIFIIFLSYYLLLSLKWNIFNKVSTLVLLITLTLLYILWLEFYQIFHIINFFSNINWVFDFDEYIWNLDIDVRRTRIVNNYVSICLFAKFWHLVFIFIFWVFFILRINEINKIKYFYLSTNLQNFIILYFMSWLYMYPWLKFIFTKFLSINYFWFFNNNRYYSIYIFFNDLKLIFYGATNNLFNIYSIINLYKFRYMSFYYWISSSTQIDFSQYRKFIIRDNIIYNLNNYIL